MHPEDLPDPGTYVDPETGDIWEKSKSGKWHVDGLLHKPFPHSLTPEQNKHARPADVVHKSLDKQKDALDWYLNVWRPVVGYPRYELNRNGDIRYIENKMSMAPSMQDMSESYYPLITEDHMVHVVPLSVLLDKTFPESRD